MTLTPISPEIMRHIPALPVLQELIRGDLRRRVDILWLSAHSHTRPGLEDSRRAIDHQLNSIAHWLDRIADATHVARRSGHHPSDLKGRLDAAFAQAGEALAMLRDDDYRRRTPFHHFDRSRSESIVGAFVVLGCKIEKAIELVEQIDPDIRFKVNESIYPTMPARIDAELPVTA
ncbi:MAG TPA: hypothetical protein VHL58_10125 [Thermoanaerobaculia bacterium]|nr:hypothetical protein [Thermoanaerobaculia bacterium]